MNEAEFKARMFEAQSYGAGDYLQGYRRGLRRLYHGEAFGTAEEHARWMALGTGADDLRADMGRGYRDGFEGGRPTP